MKSVFDFDVNMREKKEESKRLVWRSGKDKLFSLVGSDALGEDGFYRLTAEERAIMRPINEGAAWLGEHSAGIQARFETDSSQIFVRTKLKGKFNMTNMTQIGQCGMDLYVFDEEMGVYVLHDAARFPFDGERYECGIGHFASAKKQMRKYLLYFPLYIAVEDFYIGLDEGAQVAPLGFSSPYRIGVYGTSITQGCSASRPGMAYTNILSRRLDEEVLNFGFSGVAFAEKEMGELLGKRRIDCLIVDAEPNAGVDDRLKNNLKAFLDAFFEGNAHAKVILFTRVLFALDRYDGYRINLRAFYQGFMKELAAWYRKRGFEVYFADGSKIFKGNYTEYTADGVHPDDLGMTALADAYERKIKRVRGIR